MQKKILILGHKMSKNKNYSKLKLNVKFIHIDKTSIKKNMNL